MRRGLGSAGKAESNPGKLESRRHRHQQTTIPRIQETCNLLLPQFARREKTFQDPILRVNENRHAIGFPRARSPLESRG